MVFGWWLQMMDLRWGAFVINPCVVVAMPLRWRLVSRSRPGGPRGGVHTVHGGTAAVGAVEGADLVPHGGALHPWQVLLSPPLDGLGFRDCRGLSQQMELPAEAGKA